MFEHMRGLLREKRATISPEEEQRLAAAVLLFEIARADFEHHPVEMAALRQGLARDFGVPEATLDALITAAQQRSKDAVSLYEFVQTLNRTMSPDDKRKLLKLLWQVAQSDGVIDPQEEHLVRQLADLLHLSHTDFIRGKFDAGNS
jgi:uncharacterized tellurite resistance protein B-like protein